jgi:hypothetical protein
VDVHPLSLHDLDITSSILVIGNMIIYITLMMPGFYSVYVQAKDLVGYRSPVTAAYLIRFGPRQTDPWMLTLSPYMIWILLVLYWSMEI